MTAVLSVGVLFVLIFGILGVQLFSGKFASCDPASLPEGFDGDVHTKALCLAAGGAWENPSMGDFDHIGAASLKLFEIATMSGWEDLMFAGMDAADEKDNAPVRDNSAALCVYFLAWVVIGGFFMTNTIVGAIVDSFTDLKEEREVQELGGGGHLAITEAQQVS